MVAGNHLGTGAVEADGVAERNMEIQRQRARDRVLVTVLRPEPVFRPGDARVEAVRGRVGGVARPGLVVTLDQSGVKYNVLGHGVPLEFPY